MDMLTETNVVPNTPVDAPLGAAAGQPAAAAPIETTQGKNIIMPKEAFNGRLKSASERGERAAMEKIAAQAKAAGFSDMAEMFAAVAALKNRSGGAEGEERRPKRPAPQPTPQELQPVEREQPVKQKQQAAAPNWKEQQRYQRQAEQERKNLEAERKARISAERKARDLTRKQQEMEANFEIERTVFAAGVKDVGYVAHLLKTRLETMSPEEVNGFDDGKYFADLRAEKPHLFGEVIRPATTGTGPNTAPPAPQPGKLVAGQAAGAQVDVRDMKPNEYQEYLRRRGLDLNAAGF